MAGLSPQGRVRGTDRSGMIMGITPMITKTTDEVGTDAFSF